VTDIHCHLLHGIDDGPRDMDSALRLCLMAMENGIDQIIATPHLTTLGELEAFIAFRDDRLEELRAEIRKRELLIKVYPGAEVFASEDFFYAIPMEKATLNGSRYILVEFDFVGMRFSTVLRYLEEILSRELVPIVAHPERYSFLQVQYDRVNFLMDMGVLFQINAGSLAGMGNKDEFDLAYEMVLKNAASFIGSDAHSFRNRPNELLRMIRSFPPNISQKGLDKMLNLNPQAVIKNETIMRSLDSGLLRKRRY
jgi:protein-tyrosine phosphatase